MAVFFAYCRIVATDIHFIACMRYRRGRPAKPFWPVRCRPAGGAGRLPKRTAVAGGPLRDSITAHSGIMAGLYEPRITNHEPRLFPRTQMRLRRDRLMIVLRRSAVRHKFQLCTGFRRDALTGRPLRYRIQAMGEKEATDCKKYTATALCVGADL